MSCADWIDDELKLRALSVADLDKAAADAGEGLRIYLEDTRPLNAIAGQLRQAGKGIVTLVVPGTAGQEVEIKLKDTPAGHRRHPQRDQIAARRGGGGDVIDRRRLSPIARVRFPILMDLVRSKSG